MRYIPNTPEDRRGMFDEMGVRGFDELISDIPEHLRLKAPLDIPKALSEYELLTELGAMAGENSDASKNACFLGGGAYDHFIPSVVQHIVSRSEYSTSYTPYQAEVSQGTLQAAFEYQSMVCELTGMDVANASMYDGASATAEAALMAQRLTKRDEVAISTTVHPNYRRTLRTYLHGLGAPILDIPYSATEGVADLDALAADITEKTACVILQYPNFFGCVEDIAEAVRLAHAKGALVVAVVDPISLGLLKSPGELGVDIAVGEGQGMGKTLSYGGPYLGFFASREANIRQMPGRLVGETKDANGKRGYVLTLQAREQHIKRERATSNICTNEALVALMATVYMAAMGRHGIRKVAELCLRKASYAMDELVNLPGAGRAFSAPFCKEFVVKTKKGVSAVNKRLLKDRIIGGLDLGTYYPELKNHSLIAVTEKRTKDEIGRLVKGFR